MIEWWLFVFYTLPIAVILYYAIRRISEAPEKEADNKTLNYLEKEKFEQQKLENNRGDIKRLK